MNEQVWRINLLGPLEAHCGASTLPRLSMRRAGALLAYLILRAPQPVAREELLARLWPDEATDVARNRLRVLLNSLRQSLEPEGTPSGSVLTAERLSVGLVPASFIADVTEFRQTLLSVKTATDEESRIANLENALTLYRGELLTGFYDDWILVCSLAFLVC